MSSTSAPSSSSPPSRLPFVLLSLLGFLVGYSCQLGFSILVTLLDAGFNRWFRKEEMRSPIRLQGRRPSQEESDSFSVPSSSSEFSLRSLPSSSDYSDLDLVQIAGEARGGPSNLSSPTSSPQQQQRSGGGGRRKRWNSEEEATTKLEQVDDQLLHLPPSTNPSTNSPPPPQPSRRRSRSTSADSNLFRRRTFAFQPNDVPYPRYVDSFQPSFVDETPTPSPSPATPQQLPLPSLSTPLTPQPQTQPQTHRRRALSESHLLLPSSRRSTQTTTSSLHARAHPATYLAYWLDLADSSSLFDSSNDEEEEEDSISDEEEGSFDDDGNIDSDENDERDQAWMEEEAVEDNDNASLPSTTSSFHLSTLFEDSDSDEDDPDAPLHIEHYSPTPPLNLHSTSSPSSSSSPNSASPSTHPSLLPPFTHDQFISFLADGSQASARPPSRTRTSVYPVVTPDDDSSSSEDDSDSDDEEVDGHVVRILAEERAEGRDPWRPLATRRGGGERSSGEGGLGAGFDTRNSLGLEMWLRGAEAEAEAEGGMVGGSENGESWREVRDGGITEEEGDEHLGEFTPHPSSPRSSYSPLPSSSSHNHNHTHRPRQRYKKVLVDLGLRLTPHLSSPFSEILAEKWRLCEEVGQEPRRLGGSPLRQEVVY
ncbi:hypothetical protein BDY24DRAFT_368128 [Mrakia frigida]|uniref:uncharacterized protein n=1 Tax=Mrakia frigida TaxID=29902 RepID=UPI003FCC1EBF